MRLESTRTLRGYHVGSSLSENLIQSCVSGIDSVERYPPHPQPNSRVGETRAGARELSLSHTNMSTCHCNLWSSVGWLGQCFPR